MSRVNVQARVTVFPAAASSAADRHRADSSASSSATFAGRGSPNPIGSIVPATIHSQKLHADRPQIRVWHMRRLTKFAVGAHMVFCVCAVEIRSQQKLQITDFKFEKPEPATANVKTETGSNRRLQIAHFRN
jgi:hypothetical protein